MAENWKDLRIAEQRVNELLYLWESETEEPWSQEWRLELNELERELVAVWDESWLKGLYKRKGKEKE
mgnify:FL=1